MSMNGGSPSFCFIIRSSVWLPHRLMMLRYVAKLRGTTLRGVSVQRGGARLLRTCAPRLMASQGPPSEEPPETLTHFRSTAGPHPLGIEKLQPPAFSQDSGIWINPTVNHVWADDEIDKRLSTQPRHQPVYLNEKIAHSFLQFCYKAFNFVTGYKAEDPSTDSVAFRLIFLESVAGCLLYTSPSPRDS